MNKYKGKLKIKNDWYALKFYIDDHKIKPVLNGNITIKQKSYQYKWYEKFGKYTDMGSKYHYHTSSIKILLDDGVLSYWVDIEELIKTNKFEDVEIIEDNE